MTMRPWTRLASLTALAFLAVLAVGGVSVAETAASEKPSSSSYKVEGTTMSILLHNTQMVRETLDFTCTEATADSSIWFRCDPNPLDYPSIIIRVDKRMSFQVALTDTTDKVLDIFECTNIKAATYVLRDFGRARMTSTEYHLRLDLQDESYDLGPWVRTK